MSNEIKEILEYYRKYMSIKDCIKLSKIEDYITNLQQKVEQYENPDDLTLFYMWLDEKAKDKMKHLQQENERLKKKLDCKERLTKIMPENTEFIILSKADYDRQENEIELALIDYKSRVEKADELLELKQLRYLNEPEYRICTLDLQEVRNILQGDKD